MTTDYLQLAIIIGLVATLMIFPRIGIAKPAVLAALMALAMSPTQITAVLSQVGPSLVGVLVMMTAVQLAVAMALDERGNDILGALISRPLHARILSKIPASILLPTILMPLAMACAAVIHNIPAVALLAPIAFTLAQRLRIPWIPSFVGLIPASNLGGASAAWGDTPAIIQRQIWGFDVSTFATNMMPKNLVILFILTTVIATWTFWVNKRNSSRRAAETFERIRLRDQSLAKAGLRIQASRDQYIGALGLVGLFGAQALPPTYALAASMMILAMLFAFRTSTDFLQSAFVLGFEALLAIAALFTLSAIAERNPILEAMVHDALSGTSGQIEVVAFLVTSMISADGAATMLAGVVHAKNDGSLDAAWSLASGICAGSTALLTSASAGPIIIEAAKRSAAPLTFRTYASFGVPFSLLMIAAYLVMNLSAAR